MPKQIFNCAVGVGVKTEEVEPYDNESSNKGSKMMQARKKKANYGFTHAHRFLQRCDELREWNVSHKGSRWPSRASTDPYEKKLGGWMDEQRAKACNRKLSREQIDLLDRVHPGILAHKKHISIKFTYANGDVYYGGWADDDGPHGEGRMKYTNGNVYTGQWEDGKKHGEGTMQFASGAVYEGGWKCGLWHGQGKIKYASGVMYEGGWDDGYRHGEGRMKYTNGNVYTGQWEDGKKQGDGTMQFASGAVYEGGWKCGEKHGQGKMLDTNGALYEGGWKKNMWDGEGKYVNADGDVYSGQWARGFVHGKCKVKYANGNFYEGDFHQIMAQGDNEHGEGILKYYNGDLHDGVFRWRHGKGKMTYADGSAYSGNWEDGKKHGAGELTEANGDEYKQEYNNGKLLSSKRVAILINGPQSQRQCTTEAIGVVVLNGGDLLCPICGDEYSFDLDTSDENAKKHLPVITSCDHTCCHGCILKWQVARAEMKHGRVTKRVRCMECKRNSAICPSKPKYNRMLIDLIGRCVPVKVKRSE